MGIATPEQARAMNAARVSKRSGRSGGKYPKDHDPGAAGGCQCRGCQRVAINRAAAKLERDNEALAKSRARLAAAAAKVLRLEEPGPEGWVHRPGKKFSTKTVERPDIDPTFFDGA